MKMASKIGRFNLLALVFWAISAVFFSVANAASTDNSVAALFKTGKTDGQGVVLANPEGSVTLVEFTDYNCGYCRRMSKVISHLLQTDKDLRVVVVDYPAVSPYSATAAAAALAANQLGKYTEFHEYLMNAKGAVNDATIQQAVTDLHLDQAAFDKAWHDPATETQVKDNLSMGRDVLNLTGTPTLFLAKTQTAATLPDFTLPSALFGFRSFAEMKKSIDEIK